LIESGEYRYISTFLTIPTLQSNSKYGYIKGEGVLEGFEGFVNLMYYYSTSEHFGPSALLEARSRSKLG
jgi:hypothetical protein